MWISKTTKPSIVACNPHVSILTEAECCANTITALSLDITMCSNIAPARYNLLLIKANTETIDNVTYQPPSLSYDLLLNAFVFHCPSNIQLIFNLFTWLLSTDFFQLSVRQCCYQCLGCDQGCVLYSGNILLSQLRPSTARHRTHTFAFYWKLAAIGNTTNRRV